MSEKTDPQRTPRRVVVRPDVVRPAVPVAPGVDLCLVGKAMQHAAHGVLHRHWHVLLTRVHQVRKPAETGDDSETGEDDAKPHFEHRGSVGVLRFAFVFIGDRYHAVLETARGAVRVGAKVVAAEAPFLEALSVDEGVALARLEELAGGGVFFVETDLAELVVAVLVVEWAGAHFVFIRFFFYLIPNSFVKRSQK